MVYVDNMNAPYRGMVMCHMIADTTKELLEMVDKIGVRRKWIQYPGTQKEHFDICLSKKVKALKYGAREVTVREIIKAKQKRVKEFYEISLPKLRNGKEENKRG